MNSKHKWMKVLLPVSLLLVITLLFLEIPKIYYQHWDRQLLEESGYSKYEERGTQNVASCLQKAEVFFSYSSTLNPSRIDHNSTMSDDELYDTVLKLVQELNQLLGGNSKGVLEEMLIGYKEAQGFTARIIYGDSYWNVGLFEFSLPSIGMNGTILYDVDSYKIFWVEWLYPTEIDETMESFDENSVLKYYEGMISREITWIVEPGYVLIAPFREEVIRVKLLDELYGWRNFFAEEIDVK